MLTLEDFNFHLPKELIAQKPSLNKEFAKLLEIKGSSYTDYIIKDIVKLIHPNDLLIVNNTKVIKSRILSQKGTSSFIITLHKALDNGNWLAFSNKTKKLIVNDCLNLSGNNKITIVKKLESGDLEVRFTGEDSLDSFLEKYGYMPLPPYVKRKNINTKEDEENYQSIFAKNKGAVAAPTASLHFTDNILRQVKEQGTKVAEVTLHVGAGTFLPVKTNIISEHKMHSEYGEIPLETANLINQTINSGYKIIAVGTTALRILEYVASINNGSIANFKGAVNIFIYPGYKFKIVEKLITNFHTPKSTLLMLVCAFAGTENIKRAYNYAISKKYNFFSYGDCTFLHKQ